MILKKVSGMDKNKTRPISDGNPTYVEGLCCLNHQMVLYSPCHIYGGKRSQNKQRIKSIYTHIHVYM